MKPISIACRSAAASFLFCVAGLAQTASSPSIYYVADCGSGSSLYLREFDGTSTLRFTAPPPLRFIKVTGDGQGNWYGVLQDPSQTTYLLTVASDRAIFVCTFTS